MLPRRNRIRVKEFGNLSKGKSLFSPYFTLKCSFWPEKEHKVAVVVSGKIISKAVERNRLRRRVYAIVGSLLPTLPRGGQLIFIMKKEAREASASDLEASIRDCVARIGEKG